MDDDDVIEVVLVISHSMNKNSLHFFVQFFALFFPFFLTLGKG